MIQRLVKYLVIFLSGIVLIAGCSISGVKTQEYFDSAKEFNKIYFQVVGEIEFNSNMKSLKSLQSEENIKNIERLGVLLENIRQTIPKDREPLIYDFQSRYDDLVFLKNSHERYSELSIEEKRRFNMAMINIKGYKDDWNDKNSTTVWE